MADALALLFYGAIGEGTPGWTFWVFIILRGIAFFSSYPQCRAKAKNHAK